MLLNPTIACFLLGFRLLRVFDDFVVMGFDDRVHVLEAAVTDFEGISIENFM